MQFIFRGPSDLWVADRKIAIYLAFVCVGSSLYLYSILRTSGTYDPLCLCLCFSRYVLDFGTLVLRIVALGVQ